MKSGFAISAHRATPATCRLGGVTLAILLAMGTSMLALPAAAGSVKVQSPVPYAKSATVREQVKDQCKLGEKLASFLAESNSDVQLVEGSPGRSGSVLVMEITEVHASGGGEAAVQDEDDDEPQGPGHQRVVQQAEQYVHMELGDLPAGSPPGGTGGL